MNRKTLWIAVAAIVVAGAWYAFRPERLFINQTVNEGFPVEQARASEPRAIYSGRFHDGAHKTTGKAAVYQQENGQRLLRLSEFETSNGPDVQLYLVAAPDAMDSAVVTRAGFVTLGALKGNKGDQNYEIPAGTDLDKYRSVTVWCRRFAVNFGTAPLMAENGSTASRSSAQPILVSTGMFHDGAHKTAGKAEIYALPGGHRLLRLSDFETSNGPDVQLYLVKADDARDNETVKKAGFVSLGALKGNRGDQNYDVPADVDLAAYRAVTVWCRRFSVNFGTAPLTQQQ